MKDKTFFNIRKMKFLNLLLLLCPKLVYASNGEFSVLIAIFVEAFVTIHMSIFVLYPIANLLSEEPKKLFLKLFIIRIAILLFFDLFITTNIAIIDFILVFIGAFIVVPILSLITKKSAYGKNSISSSSSLDVCPNCKTKIQKDDKFCANCGLAIAYVEDRNTKVVKSNDFDPMYQQSEEKLLESFLKKEISKAQIDLKSQLIPSDVLKKKKIMLIIFSLLTFVFFSSIFFHVGTVYYIIGLVILFIFYKKTQEYNFMKFLKKEVKARPSENISNLVMSVKESFVKDNSKNILIIGLITCLVLSSLIYFKPHAIYEKTNDGYVLRFYTVGLSNMTSVEISEVYKGKNVVGIRGQVFKNMSFLKNVKLPNTITEMRGQIFQNDKSLKKINIPTSLTYLGGSAFKNCKSLKEIELPESLEYLGGETFANASSLVKINLPSKLTEIRGNTFENAKSLKRIDIPDNVTRIGGHAFYGASSLEEVNISEESKLESIGSSAFRLCSSLDSITIPSTVSINSRAFKESPTKIKKYGEVDYGNLIDGEQFTYDTFLYITVGNTDPISSYQKKSIMYNNNASLTLKSINITSDGNEFLLEYKDDLHSSEFKLNKTTPSKKINEDLVVEISASYVFSNSSGISLNAYYN